MNPRCGGKFLESTEEILGVGENFKREKKRSSVWGKISREYRRDPQCGGTLDKVYRKVPRCGGTLDKVYRRDPRCGGTLDKVYRGVLSVGEHSVLHIQKKIVSVEEQLYNPRRDPQCGGK